MRISAPLLARLLFPDAPRSVTITPGEVIVERRHGVIRLPNESVRKVTTVPGIIWSTVQIVPSDSSVAPLKMRSAGRGATETLARAWCEWGLGPRVQEAAAAFRELLSRDAYFNHNAWLGWLSDSDFASPFPLESVTDQLPETLAREFRYCRHLLAAGESTIADRNALYVESKMAEHRSWFARAGGGYALTDEQQEAILRDEDNCLVLAGAGTGKTSTVAGKVGYLLRTGAAKREQILLLAFTRKAADEMRERIAASIGANVAVCTFHSLGLEIVSHARGKQPALARFVEDPRLLSALLTRLISALLDDPATRDRLVAFYAYHLFPYRSPFEFASQHEYFQHLRRYELRTLRGELVKSHEEIIVANWLHLNGVEYVYERDYPHDTASIQHRQYRPDFYLPQYDLYIEHFGVDRMGNAAPGVDAQKYREGMAWKRSVHARYKTRLVETYSYERMEGTLVDSLATKLRAAGVVPEALPPDAVRTDVERLQLVDPLVRLLSTFLNLFKGNLWHLDELEAAARATCGRVASDSNRSTAFLQIFGLVHAAYERELARAGEIDFNDMISLATEAVLTGAYQSPFTHVIVDEFQDLSRGRGRLIRALLDQVPDRRLFCVGDDWQSIYRFTGSDIGQMTSFNEAFGFAHRAILSRTHRLNAETLEASAHFVQQNPSQLRKRLSAARRLGAPAIEVHGASSRAREELVDATLARITKVATRDSAKTSDSPASPSVLVLGRYRHSLTAKRTFERNHRDLNIRWLTVHTAKGLEADYAVVLDVVDGKFGFPSEIVDDPILDLVLAAGGDYENAEERRLFYVALTRAKHRVYLLTDSARPSKFIDEMTGPAYADWVSAAFPNEGPTTACRECGGALVRRAGPHGAFWGCCNFPLCEGSAARCPACEAAPLMREGHSYRCAAPSCGASATVCPSCGVGILREREGPHGTFYGCSEWRPAGAGASCNYTRRGSAREAR